MNEDHGQRVKTLFNACADLTADQQFAYIQKSDESRAVKARVLQLLNYSGDIDAVLAKSVLNTAKSTLEIDDLQPGTLIEQYKLQKKIGEGGQGEVWLAQRHDGEFEHQVAIKFIKVTATEKELQRFQSERELLATLQHPNIATLIGGGQLDQRLYMIMEWIDGVSLMSYLTEKKLSLNATIKCFLQICEAVSHAHSQGIIHRDIKPSNIMVTADGVVKLLDFGIAKAIEGDMTQTQSDVMMTFVYSTPEQVSGKQVTTATDVYALGLVLYEMLTGLKAQHNTESPAALVQEVTSNMPLKPSMITSQNGSERFASRLLQGDLDNLVMKAIRKEPERRYNNADALINDVNNYLHSKPLNASGDGVIYRLQKLFKRNPLSSTLAIAVLGFMVLLPVLMFRYGVQLKAERDHANEQALIANKTKDFLSTLFESVSPLGSGGESITLERVLEQGERQLAAGLAGQPEVEASLSMIMASIQHHLKNTPKAIDYYRQAVDGYTRARNDTGLLSAQGQLAVMLFRDDQVEASEQVFKAADQTAQLVTEPKALVIHETRKATVATERGKREEAAVILEQVYAELGEQVNQDIETMARLYHVWGEAIKYSDKERALEFAQKSKALTAQQVGKIHPFYLQRVNSEAVRLKRLNRHAEAQVVLDEVLSISEKLYSKDHPRYASNLSEKAGFLHDRGYFKQAEAVYRQSIEIFQRHYGENNFETARMINNLAYLYEDMGMFEQALPLYEKSIQLRIELDPENNIRAATAQANLTRLLAKLHRHNESTALLKAVMPVYATHKRNNLYNNIIQMANLVGLGDDTLSCQQALQMLDEIEPELAKQSPKGWSRLGAEVWISQMLKACGFKQQAKQWLEAAAEKSKDVYLPDSDGRQQITQMQLDWQSES